MTLLIRCIQELCWRQVFLRVYVIYRSNILYWSDPKVPKLRNWLNSIGAGAYLSNFIEAGYDFDSIVQIPLTDKDCDCVNIPPHMEGLRRKLRSGMNIKNFVDSKDEEVSDAEEEEGEESDEEGSEDGDD
jgi:hypothetical protein